MTAELCVKGLDKLPISPRKTPKAQSPAIAIIMMIPIFITIVYNKILMKRILFLALGIIPFLGSLAQANIEIYVNGHKYDSLQAYEASKSKTLNVTSNPLSEATMHKLYILSVEKGMVTAFENFYRTFWAGSDFTLGERIAPDQMQEAIKKAVTASGSTKLLIAGSGKVRIMTINTDEAQK